jgi:subtilisin family serine protease
MSGFEGTWIRRTRPRRVRARVGARIPALIALLALVASIGVPAVAAADPPTGDRVKVIVTFAGHPGKAAAKAIERAGGKVGKTLALVNGIAAELPRGQIKKLAADPLVSGVERDPTLRAFDHGANTGDLEYENAWGVEHIGTPAVHAAGIHGEGVKVAVIDTGIDYIHDDPDDVPYNVDPEFASNYVGGYDFFNDDADPYDDNGHGTHVSGILAAEKNGYLVVGVAPRVDLYALKILGANGEGDVSDLILALQWALDNDIDVVNMSLGTHEVSPALASAVTSANAQGLLMVAASGNVNPAIIQELLYGCPVAYPGAYPEVLSTTFTNGNNALTGYSCTGPEVDFASPGNNIYSPVPTGSCMICSPLGYKAESGTSMASPHLAGSVALLLSAGIGDAGTPGLLDDVRQQLCTTADPGFGVNSTPIPQTDPRYPKYFGCGVIDADGAVLSLPPTGNQPPVAGPDGATIPEDTATDVDVLANDSDPDGDPLAISLVGDPANGTTSVNPDSTVHYLPDLDFSGVDTFAYTVSDGNGGTATGSVAVSVTPVNDAPIAVDDVLVTLRDTAGNIAVLANDLDADGDALAVTGVSTATYGTLIVETNSSITYQPASGYSGPDAFDYSVDDGHGGTATGHVAVTVAFANQAPIALDDAATVAEDGSASIDVLANDTDPDGGAVTVIDVGPAGHGSATLASDGTVTYVPAADYSGPDAFDYTIADGIGSTDTATVAVTVTATNDPPTATADTASTNEDTAVTIDVVANDADIDGDSLTPTAVSSPGLGSVAISVDGTLLYTPPPDYYGSDSFGYTVSDGNGGTASASVSVSIASVNDAPTAAPKTATTPYQTAVNVTLTGSDVETCDLGFQIVSPPLHGTLGTLSNVLCVTFLPPYSDSSKVKYTPAAGWSGTDEFTYRTSDGSLTSPPVTVSITTSPPVLLHVGDLDGSRSISRSTWTAKVTIRVHNVDEASIGGVTVSGVWSGGGTATCRTSSSGVCTVQKGSIPKSTQSVTFTVMGLTFSPTGVYDPTANHDPDADSDGTLIVVLGT